MPISTASPAFFSAARLRLLHSYLSAFIAPTILFFAISGVLQIYHLHEAHGSYTPNSLLVALGRLHKDQLLAPAHHGARPTAGPPHVGPSADEHVQPPPALATQLLKALFAIDALALVATTIVGVWIGVTHPKRARSFWVVIAAGTLLPLALIVL